MHSQLSCAVTVARWTFAFVGLALGCAMLFYDGRDAQQRLVGVVFLLFGAGLIGLDVYLRRTRKTLVLSNSSVDVRQRGVSLGSFPAAAVQHLDVASRVRGLIKFLLFSILCAGFGVLVYYTGDARLGLGLLVVGVISMAASIWDFLKVWEVALPKPEGGYRTVELQKPGEPTALVLTYPKLQRTILLRKPDVVQLLGFWPPDVRKSRANQ